MAADATQRKCPTCGKSAPSDTPQAPFCSQQCKMVDLGRWFLEDYRVPVREPDPEDLEALAEAEQLRTATDDDGDVH